MRRELIVCDACGADIPASPIVLIIQNKTTYQDLCGATCALREISKELMLNATANKERVIKIST